MHLEIETLVEEIIALTAFGPCACWWGDSWFRLMYGMA
jgi:hypothetical protein